MVTENDIGKKVYWVNMCDGEIKEGDLRDMINLDSQFGVIVVKIDGTFCNMLCYKERLFTNKRDMINYFKNVSKNGVIRFQNNKKIQFNEMSRKIKDL